MGFTYNLINLDKKEIIMFKHINTGTKVRELSGTIISSAIVTYYLLANIGNRISFVNDNDSEVELFGIVYQTKDFYDYNEVTNEVVEELVAKEIFRKNGKIWIDKEEDLFHLDLDNIWDEKVNN